MAQIASFDRCPSCVRYVHYRLRWANVNMWFRKLNNQRKNMLPNQIQVLVWDYETTKPWSIWYPSIRESAVHHNPPWNAFLWILKKSFFLSERSRLLKRGSGGKSGFSVVVNDRHCGDPRVQRCILYLAADGRPPEPDLCGSLQNNRHVRPYADKRCGQHILPNQKKHLK